MGAPMCRPLWPELVRPQHTEEPVMGILLLVLLLALIFGGLGFALHALWIVAVIILAVWLIGFVVRSGERARWYRW